MPFQDLRANDAISNDYQQHFHPLGTLQKRPIGHGRYFTRAICLKKVFFDRDVVVRESFERPIKDLRSQQGFKRGITASP